VKQKKKLKRFNKIKDLDILLQEQEMIENSEIASFKINKNLFIIDEKDVETLKFIGENGNSTQYLVKWNDTNAILKTFHASLINTGTTYSYSEFEKELQILASTSHPNILQFYGAMVKLPRIGILTEYAEKGTLSSFIKSYKQVYIRSYPMKEKFRIIKEVASALDYLHSVGIIFRNLDTERVVVSKNMVSKLSDFGLAKITDNTQNTRQIGISHTIGKLI